MCRPCCESRGLVSLASAGWFWDLAIRVRRSTRRLLKMHQYNLGSTFMAKWTNRNMSCQSQFRPRYQLHHCAVPLCLKQGIWDTKVALGGTKCNVLESILTSGRCRRVTSRRSKRHELQSLHCSLIRVAILVAEAQTHAAAAAACWD